MTNYKLLESNIFQVIGITIYEELLKINMKIQISEKKSGQRLLTGNSHTKNNIWKDVQLEGLYIYIFKP